jgi:hypothetical protein
MFTIAGVLIINVTDKSNPVLLNVEFTSCNIEDGIGSAEGNEIFFSCSQSPHMYIYIVNVTVPTAPAIISVTYGTGYIHRLFITKDQKTLFTSAYSTGVQGIGISSLTSPIHYPLIHVTYPYHLVASSNGEYLFIICFHTIGVQIYNLTDPNNPNFISYYNSTSNLDYDSGVLLFQDTVLAVTSYEYLRVYFFNVTNISNPVLIESYYWSSNYPGTIANLNDRFLIITSINPVGGGENYLDIRKFPTVTSLGVYNTNAGNDFMLRLSIG